MAKRLTSLLFFLTAVATLSAGLAIFSSDFAPPSAFAHAFIPFGHALSHPFSQRVIVPWAIYDFAAPTVFFLAGVSTLRSDEASLKSGLITGAAVSLVLTAICFHYNLGWKWFFETAGPLSSLAVIVGSSAKQPSTIAVVGAAAYGLLQGQYLVLSLQDYWSSIGGSFRQLLMTISVPLLVTVSLATAISSKTRRLRGAGV
jgi:hypothetical protein